MNDSYNGQTMTDFEEEIDWENVGNPPPANHGFNVEFVDAAHAFAKSSGKHMIKCKVTIVGWDPKNDDEKFMGRQSFVNLNFTQQGGFLTKNLLEVAGIDLPRKVDKATLEDLAASLVGVVAGCTFKHREYQGQLQADVSKFTAPYDTGNQIEGTETVDDQTQGGENDEEQLTEEQLETSAPAEEEEPAPAPPPRRSLREAAAAATAAKPAPKAAPAPAKAPAAAKTNGHVNGTNGAAKKAAPAPQPAKKAPAGRPQPRR